MLLLGKTGLVTSGKKNIDLVYGHLLRIGSVLFGLKTGQFCTANFTNTLKKIATLPTYETTGWATRIQKITHYY